VLGTRHCVAWFETGSIPRRPELKLQNQTPSGSFSGAESKRLVIALPNPALSSKTNPRCGETTYGLIV
jgi:hypothetical protein